MMVTKEQLMQPLINALIALGGSGSVDEIYDKVVELEKFDEEMLSILQDPERSSRTKVACRLAWARTDLKIAGYLENSSRGVWALTEKAKLNSQIDSREIVKYVQSHLRQARSNALDLEEVIIGIDDSLEETSSWKEELHQILVEKMTAGAFERLVQRLLRESGFIHVEVTGRTGDGGIDGKGIARINGLMSFHIAFQCKKYKGTVGSSEIRDFRGATVGRADRGLFITTGNFSKAAIDEANRDGASPIDLVDGEQLADKLKELSLGVKTEMVEKITISSDWFQSL